MNHYFVTALLVLVGLAPQVRKASAAEEVKFGAFIDAYYAYDFNRPGTFDRSFTTQPARHNEFNINLAYIEGKLEREKVHGRLALQAGTSVQNNYAGEPTIGSVSGPTLSRHIQEAYAGYRLGADTWIDAGIMLSHIGLESFISKDNLTYTRSLVADYTPYYQTGARLVTKFTDDLSAQLLVLNGWQNISENNPQKSVGTQLSYAFSPEFSVTYNTLFGKEFAFRHFHDLILKYNPSEYWNFAAQADIGFQEDSAVGGKANWNGLALVAKRVLSPSVALVGRVERFADKKQVLIAATNGFSFKTWGASLGVDTTLDTNIWWRNEVRGYSAENEIFTSHSGFKKTDAVLVSSISAAF